ncbi:MAG: glycosyltransferase family 2 protein [Verrucomicrobia bacterium]|nr:glycosyltransferase family 2 protein [Verrucomicrobiota bacterium]
MTAFIILNYNGKEDTLACLASLQEMTEQNYSCIVVDNGSKDDSAAAIREAFPQVILLETGQNLGFAGGNNVGLKHALKQGFENILLLNNDTIVDPNFLTALLKAAAEKPHISIFGARPLRYYEPDKLDHLGGVWNPEKAAFDLIGLGAPAGFRFEGQLDYVCGCATLIRRSVFDTVGLFEPLFFLYWEEADLCARAKRAGFQIDVCYEATLLHKVAASMTGGKPHIAYYWWRNRLFWMQRNLSPLEYKKIFWRKVFPEIMQVFKLRLLKKFHRKSPENILKSVQYLAATTGIIDFYCNRLGPASPMLLHKINKPQNTLL